MVALLFFAAVAPLFAAAETSRYAGETWALVDAAAVKSAALDITATKYPDSDDVTVESRLMRVYHPDGTAESQDETFTKVLTEKGKRNNRTISRGFMLPYSTVDVVQLEVLRPDGKSVPIDIAANSKESIDDSQMSANIYDPNVRILRVNIPQLDVGDMVHVVTRTTTTRPIVPGEWADINVFEGSGYIRHTSYEVRAPAEKPLQHVLLRDEVPGTMTATKSSADGGKTLVYHWEVNNVRRMFDEPRMPSYSEVLQRLVVSSTTDWPAISRWYWDVSKPHLDTVTPEMKKLVGDLTASAKNDDERMKAVFYYVSKNVRYMGLTPEKDRPGFEPHDVCLTFEKKYGVCRDKAALLVSLLRAAGLEAYPVLVSVGEKRDKESPDPFFNHAIVGVESPKGSYLLMDPTDENTVELLPAYESDQSYLVCRPEGDGLRTSAIRPPEENMMRIKTTGRLDTSGALDAKSELWFEGINDNAYRQFFARAKPDDIRRFFESRVKNVVPGAVVKSLTVTPTNMLDTSQKVHAVVEFGAASTTAFGNGKAVVTVPWVGRDFGIVNFLLDGTGLEKRQYPLRTEVACGLQEDIAIKVADGFTGSVSMPTCAPVDDPSTSYQRQYALQDGTLSCTRDFKLKKVQLSPAEYLVLKKTLEGMQNDARKAPILALADSAVTSAHVAPAGARPAVESDFRQIDMQETMTVQDAHNAKLNVKIVREVLTYNGKKNQSEVKISYNPSNRDVELVRAMVTSKTGERREISAGEINRMDAGWNAGAKRYTGEKILVANLPGVDLGSKIELEYNIITHGRPFISTFVPFQAFNDVEQKSFTLVAPTNVEVHRLDAGPAGIGQAETKTTAEGQTYRWSTGHVAALPSEPELPPDWAYRAGVQLFVGDQNAYLRELHAALVERAGQAAKTRERARQLVAAAKTPRDAVTAIRDFVAKSIRLAGPTFTELPLSELSAADTTLGDGYGHAADRAILLYALLAAADFKPEFVLASRLPPIAAFEKTAKTFPLPQSFQMPLVRVSIDGQPCYLNDTDQYAQLGSTSYDGNLAIELPRLRYFTIAVPADCRTRVTTDFEVAVTDTGKTRITRVNRYYGQDFGGRKKFFAELPPEERRRHFQELVSNVAQGARPIGDLVTKFDTYPGVEQFTVEVDHYSVVDGKFLYLDLPYTPGVFNIQGDQRLLPMFMQSRFDMTYHTVISLPAQYRNLVIAPKSAALAGPAGAGKAEISTTQADGQFTITHHLTASPAIVSASEYPTVIEVESALENKSAKLLLLKQAD